jgi:hypothetical protein
VTTVSASGHEAYPFPSPSTACADQLRAGATDSDRWSHIELEELGRRHARDSFDLSDLQARLAGADWIDDTEFAAYGLDDQQTIELRRWAQEWADDIAERLREAEGPPDD